MLACPDEVTRMEDHSLVNALPEAWPRFGFLDGPTRRLEEAFPHFSQRPPEMDLTRELRGLIAGYLEQGLDVLVVDQTSSEHRRVGMHCVKVLIPGTLPMTFGHRNRRLGLDRLRTVPVRLGHRSHALTDEDVNHDPHAFP
jgi:ribosomal protein S12 methylthiotransferase accessory factor